MLQILLGFHFGTLRLFQNRGGALLLVVDAPLHLRDRLPIACDTGLNQRLIDFDFDALGFVIAVRIRGLGLETVRPVCVPVTR